MAGSCANRGGRRPSEEPSTHGIRQTSQQINPTTCSSGDTVPLSTVGLARRPAHASSWRLAEQTLSPIISCCTVDVALGAEAILSAPSRPPAHLRAEQEPAIDIDMDSMLIATCRPRPALPPDLSFSSGEPMRPCYPLPRQVLLKNIFATFQIAATSFPR